MLIKTKQEHHIVTMIKSQNLKHQIEIEECPICTNSMGQGIKLNCNHKFCKICLIKWINVELESGKFLIKCMNPACKKRILPSDIPYRILSSRLDDRLLQYALRSMIDVIACQYCNQILGYGKRNCYICWPCTFQCDECKNNVVVKKNNELLSYFYKLKCKNCPKCKVIIDRDYGCSHISCRCGYEFCWNCRKKWNNDHSCPKMGFS